MASRKVAGALKAQAALDRVRAQYQARVNRLIVPLQERIREREAKLAPLAEKRNRLESQVKARLLTLTGGQLAEFMRARAQAGRLDAFPGKVV